MMEKRNVVETRRTPEHELTRPDDDWDKQAANVFDKPAEQCPAVVSEHGSDENG